MERAKIPVLTNQKVDEDFLREGPSRDPGLGRGGRGDGGLAGVEAAEKLALEGREVVVVEMLPEMGGAMEAVGKALLFKRLAEFSHITLLTSTTVRRLGSSGLDLETPNGPVRLPPVDAVLLAAGLRPEPLPEGFRALVPEIQVVGDAKSPRDVESAVQEGYEVAMAV